MYAVVVDVRDARAGFSPIPAGHPWRCRDSALLLLRLAVICSLCAYVLPFLAKPQSSPSHDSECESERESKCQDLGIACIVFSYSTVFIYSRSKPYI